jgi:hypothetical protein
MTSIAPTYDDGNMVRAMTSIAPTYHDGNMVRAKTMITGLQYGSPPGINLALLPPESLYQMAIFA